MVAKALGEGAERTTAPFRGRLLRWVHRLSDGGARPGTDPVIGLFPVRSAPAHSEDPPPVDPTPRRGPDGPDEVRTLVSTMLPDRDVRARIRRRHPFRRCTLRMAPGPGPPDAASELPLRKPRSSASFAPNPRVSPVVWLALVLAVLGSVPGVSLAGPPTDLQLGGRPAGVGFGPSAVDLGIAASPGTICALAAPTCSPGTVDARIQLNLTAPDTGVVAWPAVQMLFLAETSLDDGVWNPSAVGNAGPERAASVPYFEHLAGRTIQHLQFATNLLPMFVNNSYEFTAAIQAAHPVTRMTFAFADFFATHDHWDPGGGSSYHVDVSKFLPPSAFSGALNGSFRTVVLGANFTLPSSSFAQNFVQSDIITALFGALEGVGLNWSDSAHHVVVWLGASDPRAVDAELPSVGRYCSTFAAEVNFSLATSDGESPECSGGRCEPAYAFTPQLASPACEGWGDSQDNISSDSIAALAHSSPDCVGSLGGNCTIDVIEPNAGELVESPTVPPTFFDVYNSTLAWAYTQSDEWANSYLVNTAACEIATLTGGSWNGPSSIVAGDPPNWGGAKPFTCHGRSGTLPEHPSGMTVGNLTLSYLAEFTPMNASLDARFLPAYAGLGVGYPPGRITATAAFDASPAVDFVPWASFRPAAPTGVTITCRGTPGPYPIHCANATTERLVEPSGVPSLGWNFSDDPNANFLAPRESVEVAFDVVAVGGPYNRSIPVDACITLGCRANGSFSVDGAYSAATYVWAASETSTPSAHSFPAALVTVIGPASPIPASAPPPAQPPAAPQLPEPAPPVLVPQPIPAPAAPVPGAVAALTAPTVALAATAAGVIAAAVVRAVQRTPNAVRIAVRSGAARGARGEPRSAPGEVEHGWGWRLY